MTAPDAVRVMQKVIVANLESLSPAWSDVGGFVPQSRLWSAVADSAPMYPSFRGFLSALLGTKLSLPLFESIEDPETGELLPFQWIIWG
jgi:hypothetical protein